MKKQFLFLAAAAVLSVSAIGQPNDVNPERTDAPKQAYGNSGWTPDKAYGQPQPRRNAIDNGRLLRERERERERIRARELERERIRARELERERVRAREIERQRERERARARMRAGNRDRDGDGVPNRYDRQPDNPFRR
ncbi:MAG: hypothetical protein ABIT82_07555 [Ramlibacter sp.]